MGWGALPYTGSLTLRLHWANIPLPLQNQRLGLGRSELNKAQQGAGRRFFSA